MPAKAKRKPRQKPAYIPGLEPPSIPELDDAAEAYYEAKTDRQAASEVEKNTKESLVEKMVSHGQTRYITANDLVVDLLSKSNISCKKKAEAKVETNGET